jgi:ubiquinone/menaquinone biosynthesis C-methylase UbiE
MASGLPSVFGDKVASRYEDWYAGPGQRADRLETALLDKLLADFPGSTSLLDIGCGTGHFTRWFAAHGLTVLGLDVSQAMLSEAHSRNSLGYILGDALWLPFGNASFDLTSVITTLEFVSDPIRALSESVRVSRRGILLGVLNRWSIQAVRRWGSHDPVWREARFFSPFELSRLVRHAAGHRLQRITWRTTLWPLPFVEDLPLPFGDFIGLAACLRDDE